MKTAQITLDENLVREIDKAAQELGTSRSAFIQNALRAALDYLREEELGKRHRAGYAEQPVQPGELTDEDNEQAWPDSDLEWERRYQARATLGSPERGLQLLRELDSRSSVEEALRALRGSVIRYTDPLDPA